MNRKFLTLTLASVVFASNAAIAEEPTQECPYDMGGVDALQTTIDGILAMKDCKKAADTARACYWGSSADVQIAGSAQEVCERSFGKRPKVELEAYQRLQKMCWTKYTKDNPGTMYMAMAAHCALGVTEYFLDLITPYTHEMEGL